MVKTPQITSILNMSIDQSVFPDKLKKAQETPLYKKNDPLLKTNYRPANKQITYHFWLWPWKDPLGLRQHTDFFQGHSASPLIT
jgi:hypothetical protein